MSCSCPPFGHSSECSSHGLRKQKPKKSSKPQGAKRSRKPLNRESQKQRDRRFTLNGILLMKLLEQAAKGEAFHCTDCGQTLGTTLELAFFNPTTQPGHILERRKGSRLDYAKNIIGIDHPENIRVQCSDCNEHQDRENRSNPEWSKSA